MLTLHAVLGDDGGTVADADDVGRCLKEHWSLIFPARDEVAHEINAEVDVRHVVGPRDDIVGTVLEEDFCTMLARRKQSALGPDGLSCSVYRCAGGIGAKLFFTGYENFVARGSPPDGFAAGRAVLFQNLAKWTTWAEAL